MRTLRKEDIAKLSAREIKRAIYELEKLPEVQAYLALKYSLEGGRNGKGRTETTS